MSRKYIREQIVENFIYPNNDQPEYGMEIVHNINNNSVSGDVVSFSAVTATYSGITFSMNYTWNRNGAETFIRNSNLLSLCSVHMTVPNALNFKPWIVIDAQSTSGTTSSTFTDTVSFSVVPAQFDVAAFENGTYYFEVRFIGHRAIYPVCLSLYITTGYSPITPEPTPTPTPTPLPG